MSLFKNLKTQLNQLQPLKKALVKKKHLVIDYKENLEFIAEYMKYDLSYNHLEIHKRIKEIKEENKEIEEEI